MNVPQSFVESIERVEAGCVAGSGVVVRQSDGRAVGRRGAHRIDIERGPLFGSGRSDRQPRGG